MITLSRNTTRLQLQNSKQAIWRTFYEHDHPPKAANAFGFLIALDEIRLPPGAVCAYNPLEGAEIFTYVYRGALAQEDSSGASGVVQTGEFQRMVVGRDVRHKETNTSRSDWAHFFRISLRASEADLSCMHTQLRFTAAQRHNLLCVTASPDGRKQSLRFLQDAFIYSSILDPGNHIIHELLPGRGAWLHIIDGEAIVRDITLMQGDGLGLTMEPSISLTAQTNSEILLVDLGSMPVSS